MKAERLDGLDLARFVAFVGLVVVNFRMVMGARNDGGWLKLVVDGLEGFSAVTLVVLAGIVLGLASHWSKQPVSTLTMLKRVVFLFVLGLLSMRVFDADILHYYAFYLLLGAFCLTSSPQRLIAWIMGLNVLFVVLVQLLDYDQGWNWQDYSYAELWTPLGFVRNLLFNGWYPVIPWLAFLLFGVFLGYFKLTDKRFQIRLIAFGLVVFLLAELLSWALMPSSGQHHKGLLALLSTAPMPPMPLYVLSGMSMASMVIGVCLRATNWLRRQGVLDYLLPAGRQTLSLYVAHVFIGMVLLQTYGMAGNQTLDTVIPTALLFCWVAAACAWIWAKLFRYGPVEALMRRVTG